MNTKLLTVFRRAFASYDWTPAQRRAYARKWACSVRMLGGSWRALP